MNCFIFLAEQAKVIDQPNMLINIWQRWNLVIKIDRMQYTQIETKLSTTRQIKFSNIIHN